MTKTIEFFYDYVSPYSYLANSQLHNLEAGIVYRPMLLGAVMKTVGNKPPALLKPRGDYLFKDVRRWAEYYGIPYAMNPTFPVNTVKALRVAIVALEDGSLDKIHQPLFDAVWADRQDVSEDTVLKKTLEEAGLPADDIMQRIGTDTIKLKLRENTEEAIERGAFGAPTFFVNGEMFFGNDRLQFVAKALQEPALAGESNGS